FGGLETIAHNANRKRPALSLYEFGNVYFFNPKAESTAENPTAPYSEASHLALWLTGNFRGGNWARTAEEATFFDLKAIVANIFARLNIPAGEITLKPGDLDIFDTSLSIATRSGKHLGDMGVVKKSVAKLADVKQSVIYAELDWGAIVKLAATKQTVFAPLPKTMPVKRDLALLIDNSVTMAQIEAIVKESERKLLRSVELFDVYDGKNLPSGKKSYAISITLQDSEKTLQDKQIDQIMSKIVTNLKKKAAAELR
ncbi:MAG: phenylalanine--tRNA ligase subunit beta, partial [Muribaculaceae bacterium]|nr:phenylalanine--tRNA ligase subunit beta [Muribaculaceae bacterium]